MRGMTEMRMKGMMNRGHLEGLKTESMKPLSLGNSFKYEEYHEKEQIAQS